jgi:hypothetical protein
MVEAISANSKSSEKTESTTRDFRSGTRRERDAL